MYKRIAFLTMDADTQYTQTLIRTIGKQAAALGFHLLVFTHFINYNNTSGYISGEENIYSILQMMSVDGAILAGATYFNKELLSALETNLRKMHIPTIALDWESKLNPVCIQQSREPFRMLTEHFITEHGFRDLLCLTGIQGNIHAEQRAAGFRDALHKYGIADDPARIIYGDFWLNSAEKLAGQIIRGEIPKPEAVICGNDYMALQLSLTLMRSGIRVPEDIAVAGFDANPDLAHYHPALTTVGNTYLQAGVRAVTMLYEQITGQHTEPMPLTPVLRIGETCGCHANHSQNAALIQKHLVSAQQNLIFMHSSYSCAMSGVRSPEECGWTIAGNLYLLQQDSGMQICLNTDWAGTSSAPYDYRREGFSENMQLLLSRGATGDPAVTGKEIIPDILPDYPEPYVHIFTPLHYQDRAFGICVRHFVPEQTVFEPYYGAFCQVISNTIERLRVNAVEQSLQEQIEHLSERDILTGLFSRKGLFKQLQDKPAACSFAVLFELHDLPVHSEHEKKQMLVTFSQAVNLSCTGGETAARIGAERFVIVGKADHTDMPEQLVLNALYTNLRQLEAHQNAAITRHMEKITAVGTDAEALVTELEQQMSARQNSESSLPYQASLRALREQISEEPQTQWNAEEEAARIGISLSHFQHIYKECHGVSFHADLIHARLNLAKRLLRNTSLTVSEIASRCGYPDISYFMKVFRRQTGKTALEYRKAKQHH